MPLLSLSRSLVFNKAFMGKGGAMKNKRRYLTSLSKMLQARESGQEEKEEELLDELDRIWAEMNEEDSRVINKITSLFARKRIGIGELARLSKAFNIKLANNESYIVATFAKSRARKISGMALALPSRRVVTIRIQNASARTRRQPSHIRYGSL